MSIPSLAVVLIRTLGLGAVLVTFAARPAAIRAIPTHFGAEPQLSVNRSTITLGESASLAWDVGNSSHGFISSVGAVKTAGTVEVRPKSTTTYTLFVDTPSGLTTRAVTIQVTNGKRGDDFLPSLEAFKYPLTTTTTVAFGALAVQVHSVLQDEMHLSVNQEEYDSDRVRLIFVTSLANDRDLLKSGDTRIGARRVAYLISIERGVQHGTLDYTVRTMIQYRLKIEETWRTEQMEELYRASADSVRNRIMTNLKTHHLTD